MMEYEREWRLRKRAARRGEPIVDPEPPKDERSFWEKFKHTEIPKI